MNKSFQRVSLVLALAAGCQVAHANLVVNGGFEDGLAGWDAAGPVESRNDEQSTDGEYAAVFDWGNAAVTGGSLSQAISTAAGHQYHVQFDYWGWAAASDHSFVVSVRDSAGTLLMEQTLSATGSIPANPLHFSFGFNAAGSGSTISFLDMTGAAENINSDLAIDAVSVTEVPPVSDIPEASDALMMVCGFGTIAGLMLRRRR